MNGSRVLETAVRAARSRGERALLVVELAPSPPLTEGRVPDDANGERAALPRRDASSRRPPAPPDRADVLARRLGTESGCLVHDVRERLDPGLLAADVGTVPAGGALVLLVPPLERPAGALSGRFGARFARRLLRHLDEHPATSVRVAADAVSLDGLLAEVARATSSPGDGTEASPRSAVAAQDAALERLLGRFDGDRHALGVVEAPRGHGKSALLGRLAARLERAGTEYRVCAPHRGGLEALDRYRRFESGADRLLPFVAPDAALAGGGDVLLVDEAASLPLPTLEGLLGRWSRIVLATTSAGYESAGRAFALRLPALLDERRPRWFRVTLPEPMRWRAGDPLDAWLHRVLLTEPPALSLLAQAAFSPSTDATAPSPPPLPDGWSDAVPGEVDRDALAEDEARLAAVHGLLVGTHYQSTPLDLAHLLDAEHVRLWSTEHAGVPLGVAMVAVEPGIDAALHADVLARRRRLPHRLLPQLLAQSANRADALEADLARVVRLAVRPEARRHGVARQLVERLARDLGDEVEGVGASFGESAASVALWSSCGFVAFHRGFRRNPRSGRRSLAVLRAATPRVRSVLAAAEAHHRDNEGAPDAEDASGPSSGGRDTDAALLERFAAGERSVSDTRGALRRFVDREGGAHRDRSDDDGNGDAHRDRPDDARLARWLERLGIEVPPGRRAREARLRERVAARLAGVRRATR